jgi:hypothetical protein
MMLLSSATFRLFLLVWCTENLLSFQCREEHLFEHDPVPESAEFLMPSGMGPSEGVMGCGGARLGPGPGSGFTKGPMQGSHAGHGRGQASKHSPSSSSSSRLGHKQYHNQAHAQASYPHSPQHSFTSGSHSGNSSGPPSRRFPSGDSSSHGSPAGVLQFQHRQQQHHSPHHSPDHQHLPGSPLHRSGKAAEMGKPPSDGLLPSPQMDLRGFYTDANKGHLMGGGAGYVGAGNNPVGRGPPMIAGLGQPQFLGVGVPSWPTQRTVFPPGPIYATDHLFAGECQVLSFELILCVLGFLM